MRRAVIPILLLATRAWAQTGADDHLLAGAQYFREERFAEALVEFRVAERTGSSGSAWYVASALVKMKRSEEAIAAFARAEAVAAADRDALLDYYHALACYDVKLYGCADRLLDGIGRQAGPRIAAQARKIRADLAPVISAMPSGGAIDWYHARGRDAEAAGHVALAIEYFDEAIRLAALRPDGHRRSEASTALHRLRSARTAPGTTPEKAP